MIEFAINTTNDIQLNQHFTQSENNKYRETLTRQSNEQKMHE